MEELLGVAVRPESALGYDVLRQSQGGEVGRYRAASASMESAKSRRRRRKVGGLSEKSPYEASTPLPAGTIPSGKTLMIVQAHHDDYTWQWGFGGRTDIVGSS